MNDFKEKIKADAKREAFERLRHGPRKEKFMHDTSYFLQPEKLREILKGSKQEEPER